MPYNCEVEIVCIPLQNPVAGVLLLPTPPVPSLWKWGRVRASSLFRDAKSGLRDTLASFQGTSALESPREKKKTPTKRGWGKGTWGGPRATGCLPPGERIMPHPTPLPPSPAGQTPASLVPHHPRRCRPQTRGWKDRLHWRGCLCFSPDSPGHSQCLRHPFGLVEPSRCFAFLGY